MRRGSPAGGACGHRSGIGRSLVGRRHRGGQRPGRHAEARRRQDRRLSAASGAGRPRPATRAPRLRAAGARCRDPRGIWCGRVVAGRSGAGERRDGPGTRRSAPELPWTVEREYGGIEVWASRGYAPRGSRQAGRSPARSSAVCRTAGRGCGGRISCGFPRIPRSRSPSRSNWPSRAPGGWRRSASRRRAAGSSRGRPLRARGRRACSFPRGFGRARRRRRAHPESRRALKEAGHVRRAASPALPSRRPRQCSRTPRCGVSRRVATSCAAAAACRARAVRLPAGDSALDCALSALGAGRAISRSGHARCRHGRAFGYPSMAPRSTLNRPPRLGKRVGPAADRRRLNAARDAQRV